MSLLEDEESGDEIHRVNTSSNFLPQTSDESHGELRQLDRQAQPKADGKKEKEKKTKALDDHRKGSSLTLPWRKDKDKDKDKDKEEKQAKRTKQGKSKSPPPNSPKAGRAADKKALKAPPAPQPLPSPNSKASRKPYAQLSAEEEDFEELVMNVHSVDVEPFVGIGLDLGEEIRHPHLNPPHQHHTSEERLEAEPANKTRTANLPVALPIGPLATGSRTIAAEAVSPVLPVLGSPAFPLPPTLITAQPGASTSVSLLSTSPDMSGPVDPLAVDSGDARVLTQAAFTPNIAPGFGVGISASGIGVEGHANPAPASEWAVSDELRDKCHKQFTSLDPEGGLLSGEKARDFFIQSKLPTPELAQIWQLADYNCDSALSEDEFLIAMKLVLVRRKGYDIPLVLPNPLIPRGASDPPVDDLLLLGETPPIHPPLASANDLLPPGGQLGDLNYTAPIGANLKDAVFMPHPILDDGNLASADLNHPEQLVLHIVPPLQEHLDVAAVFSPVPISDDHTLLSLVTDDLLLHAHSEPGIGSLLSFEATPLDGEQGGCGEPPVGRLVSLDPETSAVEHAQEGEGEEEEKEMESPASKPCPTDEPKHAAVRLKVGGGAVRIERTRHTSVRDEEEEEEREESHGPTSPVKKSRSLRTPVRPAPPVPSHLREKPSGGTQNLSPASVALGAEPSDGTGNHASLSRKRLSAVHFDPVRGHGRSASLDLNKIFMKEEDHDDLPSATPPKPPPKPPKADHSVVEVPGGYLLVKSASTGSISNAVLASTLGEELRGQEAHPTPTLTITATTSTRQPTKMPLLSRAKVLETPPPQREEPNKESATIRVQIQNPAKEEVKKESAVFRNKLELQTSIQQYKETNATLTAINKELETALFKLIADRIDLQQKLELLQKQQ
ncbi:hypothetical protein EMCRGX_G034455 [Ephydatia muelleri]